MIKMHCFSWYSGSVHCHLTQIWNYSQRNTVDLGDSEWPNWRRRMTKSEEEGLLTIVTTFVSEIYFSMWFLESSCVDDSEYVPNLPAAMNIFFTTSVQSENLTFLGVRSTKPLPAASGLVKLTRDVQDGPSKGGLHWLQTKWFKGDPCGRVENSLCADGHAKPHLKMSSSDSASSATELGGAQTLVRSQHSSRFWPDLIYRFWYPDIN